MERGPPVAVAPEILPRADRSRRSSRSVGALHGIRWSRGRISLADIYLPHASQCRSAHRRHRLQRTSDAERNANGPKKGELAAVRNFSRVNAKHSGAAPEAAKWK